MYATRFSRSKAEKFIKKCDSALLEKTKEEIVKIAAAPYLAEELRGEKFKGIRSHHFKFRNVQYRIAYRVDEAIKTVSIAHIGTRERFYDELERGL